MKNKIDESISQSDDSLLAFIDRLIAIMTKMANSTMKIKPLVFA